MAGRKAKFVTYEGKLLHKNGGAKTVRVSFSKGNNMYVLWDGPKRVLARKLLQDIAAEFYKYTGQGVDVTEHLSISLRQVISKSPTPIKKEPTRMNTIGFFRSKVKLFGRIIHFF